jgi:Putative phage serine protease XkdF
VARFKLRNVTVDCLAIVKEGANRKRFFLRKAEDVNEDALLTLPANQRLVKSKDWSAVYCVVAEPGAVESGGLNAPDVEDEWADADEIRKAAHSLLRNGGLITKLHESLDPYGSLVENAVALADFQIDGQTIKKDSWYVGIEPSDEGKEAIEKGEFTGVSLEGRGEREPVEQQSDKLTVWQTLGKMLGVEGQHSRNVERRNPEEDEVDDAQKQQIESAAKDSKEALAKASAAVAAIDGLKTISEQLLARLPEPEAKPPTAEELNEKLTKAVEGITEIAKGIDALAQGSSDQPHQGSRPDNVREFSLAKSDDKGPIGLLG